MLSLGHCSKFVSNKAFQLVHRIIRTKQAEKFIKHHITVLWPLRHIRHRAVQTLKIGNRIAKLRAHTAAVIIHMLLRLKKRRDTEPAQLIYDFRTFFMQNAVAKQRFSFIINMCSAAAYQAVKSDFADSRLNAHQRPSRIDKCQVSIFAKFTDRLHCTLWDLMGRSIDQRSVNIKKYKLSVFIFHPVKLLLLSDIPKLLSALLLPVPGSLDFSRRRARKVPC